MKIIILAAVSENNVIGAAGGLPWKLPEDLRRFKQLTTQHTVVMGRKTWESIGAKPLPRRRTIVLSKTGLIPPGKVGPTHHCPGIWVRPSLASAIDLADRAGEDELYIVGGASVYALALPMASHLYLTRVLATIQGDTFFPALNMDQWLPVEIGPNLPQDGQHTHCFRFEIYQRVS